MKIKNLQMKKALRTVLFVLLLCAAGMTKAQTENITFADANVKAICVANWDTDGDGELNTTEAAAVTSLDGAFMFDDGITSFNELQFFTGVTSFGEDEFNSCTSLASITIPSAVTSIGSYAFSDCSSLTSITLYAFTPPTLGSNVFDNVPSALVVNVPCGTSALYQTTNGWNGVSNYEEFVFDLCPITFSDDNVKTICVAHWDTNGDGELSYAEAATVTNLGTYFKSTAITSFDELEYFTSLTSLPNTAFYGCTSLISITLPSSISALGNGSFYNCTNLATMTLYAETPPTVGTNAFKNVPINMVVHVPCGTYEAYHTANGWSEFTNVLEFGSCPIVFADASVKAICVANWDTNGDGELSYAEAAAVTDLGQIFRYNSTITSFDELKCFTGLTTIGYRVFYCCTGLTSVEISNTVTSIENGAFSLCASLTSVTIGNSVTSIGDYAFDYCSGLTSIEIPSSVTSIGTYAFTRCSGLEQIIVDSGNTVFDSRNNCNAVIMSNTNKLVIGCKNSVIPDSVTSIGTYAFLGCTGLTSITIPNSVTEIGWGAFIDTGLTSIVIPSSVTSIGGDGAFSGGSGLEQIIVDSENIVYDSRNNCNAIIETNTNKLVTGCKNTIIPNTVTSIGYAAFHSCSGLISIEIPNSVTSIGNYAFYDCSSLTSMTILANIPPTLGSYAYYNVNKSIPVYVPIGTVSAYQSASGWNEFTNYIDYGSPIIFADANVKALCVANWDTDGDGELSYAEAAAVSDLGQIFRNNSTITSFDELQYFTGLTSIGNSAFSWCNGLTSINIPNFVTSIGNSAFSSCYGLTSMEIPNHVTSIGNYAFAYCSNLISLSIGNSVTTIESMAFDYCYRLTSIEIPSSVISMNASSFSRCSGLEQIIVNPGNTVYDSRDNCNAIINTNTNTLIYGCKNTVIPNTVTSIGGSAFSECSGLSTIEIPNSVTSIGSQAFYRCYNLTTIEIPSSVTSVSEGNLNNAFKYCSGLEQIIVDPGNAVYDSRENCNAIINTSANKIVSGCKNTVIPNSVTIIGDDSFGGCSTLTSMEIPNSVVSIEPNAFGYCTGLTTIVIPNSVTYIGGSAFNHCIGLTSLTVLANDPPVGVYGYGSAFYDVNRSIPVYVPCASMLAYQNADDWNEFTNYMPATECESGEITITVNPTEGGTVTGAGYYEGGDTCTLTATANEGYSFVNWTKEGVMVSNSDTFSYIVGGDASYVANFAQGDVIIFADANVKALCIANWDTDGDGELSYAEAAAITNLGQVFRNNSTITSFDELQYFTGLTSIGQHTFDYCSNLTTITFPNSVTSIAQGSFQSCYGLTSLTIPLSVTSIGHSAFYGCSGLTFMVVYANNPPVLGNNDVFAYVNKSIPVYVLCNALNAYQNVNGWSVFTNIIGMCPGTITVVASPAEGGIVNGGGDYEYGDTCTLMATANHDYRFLNWTENGEVVSSEAEYTFLVVGDRNLVANFSFTPPAPVVAEYYPDPNEPNSPYVKVHWTRSFEELMIGDTTSTINTAYMPFYTLYDNSISEALYTAAELIEAGATAGTITSLSWEAVSVTTNQPQNNISIWMANVPDTELTTTSHLASNMALVYTGNIGIPPMGWNEFVFNESNFVWDGTSNVLILCQRNNGQWNGSVRWRSHNPGFYGMAYKYQDGTPYDAASQTYTLNISNTIRPNIIMKGEGTLTYNIYRANCDGTNTQLIAENLSDSQFIDETWWQLENASYKYGVSIADSSNIDIFWSNCIEKQGNVAVQTVTLSQGWNWVSLSIEAGDPVELLQLLEAALGDNALQIQSFDDNTEFDGEEWFGGLDDTGISNAQMYMIEVVNDCTVELQGTPANPADYEIYIEPGQWNWIGFPCTVELGIAEALANFEPEEADQIQAGNIMTEFDGEEWFGDFETLVPGQGYMYYSNSSELKILVFSTTAKGKGVILRKEKK